MTKLVRFFSVLVLLHLIAEARTAHANGAFPDSLSVIVPVDRPEAITLATNFGLISSTDGAQSWTWICETASINNGYLYQVGPPPGSRLFALSGDGKIVFSDDNGCTWTAGTGAVTSGAVVDAFPDPVDAQKVLAIVSPDGRIGSQTTYTLVETRDGGATYATLFTGMKSEVLTGVERSRPDPNVVYMTGARPPSSTPELIRSTDGGATWQRVNFSGFDATAIRLVGIDRENANKLFLRATMINGEALAVLDDAAASVGAPIVLENGTLTAFVRLAAGPLLVAGEIAKEAVLYRSDDGGATFMRLPRGPHLRGLAERDGVVYGATDNKTDGFALATSADQGQTWRPVMRFDQVSAIRECVKAACGPSCINEANRSVWPAAICGPDALQGSMADASAADAQGGRSPGLVASGSSGCSCRMVHVRQSGWSASWLAAMVFVRRRRRR